MQEELKEYLNRADPKDLADCLKENFNDDHPDRHYKMLSELYFNDKTHFAALTDGCKAAVIIYLLVGSK